MTAWLPIALVLLVVWLLLSQRRSRPSDAVRPDRGIAQSVEFDSTETSAEADSLAANGFQLGEFYTRSEIHDQLGGGVQDYLPHSGGRVVCGCFSTDLNPAAPDVILPGRGPGIEKWAEVFASQQEFIPCFIKRETGIWEYLGKYRVRAQSFEQLEIAQHAATALREDISSVLFLEREV